MNTFAIAGITVIDVDGGAGADTILVDEANGAIAVAGGAADFLLDGGDGDDSITGGSDAETLNGGNNNDTLLGRGGTDILNGGDGNDSLTGGPGGAPTPGNFEPHNGGPGDDTIIWFNGDGSDIVEGGDGNDTQRFDGNVAAADDMDLVPGAVVGRVLFTRAAGNINMDIGTTENLLINSLGGNDDITLGPGVLNGLILVTVNGGDGDDIIRGGDGPDVLNGDAGNDTITGGAGLDVLNGGDGNDTLTGNQGGAPTPGNFEQHNGGPGDDTMIWNNGDGSDLQEGGPGNDISIFNGNVAATDVMNALAGTVAGRVLFLRAAGNINMDIGTTETLQVNSLGGDDDITVQASLANLITLMVDSGAGADTIKAFLPAPFTLNGNTELDTLIFDAQGQPVQLLPNEVRSGGVTRVAHTNVETVNVLNSVGAPPTITITSPTADPTFTSSAPVIALAGTAADAEGIQSIAFTNDRGGNGTATGTTNWTANVPLAAGANAITVTVTDTNGNTASDILTVTVDDLIYTLAEGATGSFFDTDILIANPTATQAPVTINYLKGDGTTVTQTLTVAPTSRTTILVDGDHRPRRRRTCRPTIISTDAVPLVVERTMRWDATGYGAHTEKATGGPALTWLFAEGSQGFFQTFVLLANPNATANKATVTFLREGGATPVTEVFDLAPTSRKTIFAGDIPALRDQSFGIQVVFDAPGVAERAMYFGQRTFEAGHESAGVNAPATEWFLAEGATGTFFTTFLLVANPGDIDATVTYTYLPASGLPIIKTRTVAARSRWTGNIATEDVSLANAAVATRITSTQPVIAERAQVLAVHARSVVRSAQQLRRHVARPQVGPRRRPRRHRRELSDLHPAGQSEHDDGGGREGDVPEDERHDRGQELHGAADVAVQRGSARAAGTRQRVVRHADRSDERRRHRGRAGDVFGLGRRGLGGGHERARHAAAVASPSPRPASPKETGLSCVWGPRPHSSSPRRGAGRLYVWASRPASQVDVRPE